MRPDRTLAVLTGALLAVIGAAPALGQGLEGRTVLMRGETWDDPEKPLLQSSEYSGRVGPGPEFGFAVEFGNDLFVVPVTVDLGPDRLDVTFKGTDGGTFTQAAFNGYVLSFPVECTLLTGAAIDRARTTLPIKPSALTVEPTALRIDVAGLTYTSSDRIAVTLEVTDCGIS